MSRFPAELKAVLFDLDGTLIDTASEFVVTVQRLRAEHSLPPLPEADIRCQVSNGGRALTALALEVTEGEPGFDANWQRLLAIYSEELGKTATLYPGLADLLDRLEAAGIAWGISTNKPRPYTEPLVAALQLDTRAGSVVCPDDVGERKPHPETLYLNCRHLDCSPAQAIYVGDHARDVEAGRRAGMYTVGAAWGYIAPGDDPAVWGASALLADSRELEGLIFDRPAGATP